MSGLDLVYIVLEMFNKVPPKHSHYLAGNGANLGEGHEPCEVCSDDCNLSVSSLITGKSTAERSRVVVINVATTYSLPT